MSLRTLTKTVYALLGVLDVLVGVGSIHAGKLAGSRRGGRATTRRHSVRAAPDSFLNHLTQEFGTLAIAVGLVFLWQD